MLEKVLKIIVFGPEFVGLKSLVDRFVNDEFLEQKSINRGNFKTKTQKLDGIEVYFKIYYWSMSGVNRYVEQVARDLLRDADGGIFVCDITSEQSLREGDKSLELFLKQYPKLLSNLPILLIGNKIDIENQREVTFEHALLFASKYKMLGYFECSVKSSQNVEDAFFELTRKILKREEKRIKTCILGVSGVGKTSLIERIGGPVKIVNINNNFISHLLNFQTSDKQYFLMMDEFDMGGAVKFPYKYRVAPDSYYETIHAAIFMLDVSDVESHCYDGFSDLLFNLKKLEELFFKLKVPFLVIGNKIDVKERDLSTEQKSTIENNLTHGKYIECSAKTGKNVEDVLLFLSNEIEKKMK